MYIPKVIRINDTLEVYMLPLNRTLKGRTHIKHAIANAMQQIPYLLTEVGRIELLPYKTGHRAYVPDGIALTLIFEGVSYEIS